MKVKVQYLLLILTGLLLISQPAKSDYPTGAPFINPPAVDSTGGPDAYGYIWRDSTYAPANLPFVDTTRNPAGWTRVTGLGDDNFIGPFPIGFGFKYYWYTVNNFYIGSNGYIGFQGGLMASPFANIPNAAAPNDMLAILGGDMTHDAANGNPAKVYVYRNAANDSLIVSYYNVPFWQAAAPGYNGSNTFQVILSKNDTAITYIYKNVSGTTTNTDITVGIENVTGQVGIQYMRNVLVPSNKWVQFKRPSTTTFGVTDAAVDYIDNTMSGGIFKLTADSLTVRANIANTGNQNIGTPFNVIYQVRSGTSTTVIFADTMTVASLAPEASQLVTFNKKFVPATAGMYKVTVVLPSDMFNGNNTKDIELQVGNRNASTIELKYDDGTSEENVSWQGGTGEMGKHFIPPVYPARIDTISYFIAQNTNGVGFTAKILKDDGPNGAPGTQVFSQTVAAGSVLLNAYTKVPVTGVNITEGGYYVIWVMGGEGIGLGEDLSVPFSRRSVEGFNGIYSTYRNNDDNEPMIRSVIKNPTVGITQEGSTIPNKFSLSQNYPNPFNPATKINFSIAKAGLVKLTVYDMLGREISKLVNQNLGTGVYTVDFNAAAYGSGVYFYKIEANGFVETKKMLLVK